MFLHFLQSQEHKEAFLELARVVAKADGYVSGNEARNLRAFKIEMGMEEDAKQVTPFPSKRELSEIIGDIREEQIKNVFFAEILLLVFADGDYSDDEKEIVLEMKRLFGYSEEIYEKFKDWVIRQDQVKIEGMKLILDPTF